MKKLRSKGRNLDLQESDVYIKIDQNIKYVESLEMYWSPDSSIINVVLV